MKRILITGAGSYVGTQVEAYLHQWPEQYQVESIDMVDGAWRQHSFAGFDAVFHVAGIVHLTGADAAAAKELYYTVNRDMAIEVAQKAKAEGVSQFIFMSSASVYGENGSLSHPKTITPDTPLTPVNDYGISKAQAEEGIAPLNDERFRVAILRPPMIYGPGCKGNYQTLAKLARKLPLFPKVSNRRSMLYIRNLAEFIRLILNDQAQGLFCPQDREYVNTSHMVSLIARENGKKILLVPGFTWALKCLSPVTKLVDKAFGSLCYDRCLSDYPRDYCVCDLSQAIRETESRS